MSEQVDPLLDWLMKCDDCQVLFRFEILEDNDQLLRIGHRCPKCGYNGSFDVLDKKTGLWESEGLQTG